MSTLSLNPTKEFENDRGCLLLQGSIMNWFLWKLGLDDGLVGKEKGGRGKEMTGDRQWLWLCWGVKVDLMLGVWRYQRCILICYQMRQRWCWRRCLNIQTRVLENWEWVSLSHIPGFHCDFEVWDFCGVEMMLNCWIWV